MTERGRRLLDWDAEDIDSALSHPAQRSAVVLVGELITQLRAARGTKDLYEFQRALLSATLEAQERQAETARSVQRFRRGRPTPVAASGDWALEQFVWDRVVRQLRAVGDALAWRVFNFDRRFITVLSDNAPVSPIAGKTGLKREIEEVEDRWRALGQFALLHDLTSVIRIADLTVLTEDGPHLVEVKTNPANHRAKQTRRAERAVAVLAQGAPMLAKNEELDLLASTHQFVTHLPAVGKAIAAADREGLVWTRIARQLVVMVTSLDAVSMIGADSCQAAAPMRKARAFAKAEMHQTEHHLQGERLDTHTRDRGLAPYTIYPFSPSVCARLTADYLVVMSILGWDRIADAFRAVGFEVFCPLAPNNGRLLFDTPVVTLVRGDRTMTLLAWGLQQVQFEFLTIERFVRGVEQMWNHDVGAYGKRSAVLTFANEKAAWR